LDTPTLEFLAHSFRKEQESSFEWLGSLLGTNWNKDKIKALLTESSSSTRPDKFIIPLAYLIRPDIKEMLKPSITVGGEKMEISPDEEVIDLATVPKEEFLRIMNRGR